MPILESRGIFKKRSPAEEIGLLVQPLPQEAERYYQQISAAARSGSEALCYHKP